MSARIDPDMPQGDTLGQRDDLPRRVVSHPPLSSSLEGKRRGRGGWIVAVVAAMFGMVGLAIAVAGRMAAGDARADNVQPTSTQAASVWALGRLEPDGEVLEVAAPGGSGESRVDQLLVAEGDWVEAGAVLAILDSHERLAAAVQVARDSIARSRAGLARTQLEVAAARSQWRAVVRSAEARLVDARQRLVRYGQLLPARAISQEGYDDAQLSVAVAEEGLREAQARLQRYETEAAEELADLSLAKSDLAVSQSSLRQAEANLEQALVRAPIAGRILRVHRRVGERIGQSALLEMGATSTMMARVEVYESDVTRLSIGQAARLSAPPLAAELTGKVERISRLVKKQEIIDADPAANTDARVLDVWVRLDEESSPRAAELVHLQVRVELLP